MRRGIVRILEDARLYGRGAADDGYAAYASMKGAIEVLTRYLAKELGPRRISANTVAPLLLVWVMAAALHVAANRPVAARGGRVKFEQYHAAAGYYVRYFGGTWGKTLQVGFIFAALVLLGWLFSSGTLRSKLRVFINKNFFSYRYDYRQEWLRFTHLLSSADPTLSHEQRSIKALANPGSSHRTSNARLNISDSNSIPGRAN